MRVAEMLSDLTTLRACDPTASLALVSARPESTSISTSTSTSTTQPPSGHASAEASSESDSDPDLQRAEAIMRLHDAIKVADARGLLDAQLREARDAVRRAVGGALAEGGGGVSAGR